MMGLVKIMMVRNLTSPLPHLLPGSNKEKERSGCKHWSTYTGWFFSLVPPLKIKSTKKFIQARLGVSRTIYVNVDSPNLGFPYFYFLGGYQWKKSPCISRFQSQLSLAPTHIYWPVHRRSKKSTDQWGKRGRRGRSALSASSSSQRGGRLSRRVRRIRKKVKRGRRKMERRRRQLRWEFFWRWFSP